MNLNLILGFCFQCNKLDHAKYYYTYFSCNEMMFLKFCLYFTTMHMWVAAIAYIGASKYTPSWLWSLDVVFI